MVRRTAPAGGPRHFECEPMYGVVSDAYHALTGTYAIPNRVIGRYPPLQKTWDLQDEREVRQRLPRLAALMLR